MLSIMILTKMSLHLYDPTKQQKKKKKKSSINFFTHFQVNKNEPWSQLAISIQMDEVLQPIQ